MAKGSHAQRRQRELSWLLYQVSGAKANFHLRPGHSLPHDIEARVRALSTKLSELENLIRAAMAREASARAARVGKHPKHFMDQDDDADLF
jgi:hypothetical protein